MENLSKISDLTSLELLVVALGGMIGSLTKDILQDGYIELPYKKDGKVFVGFLGGALIGGFVGMAIDGNFITALLAGFTGTSIIRSLVSVDQSKVKKLNIQNKDMD